MSRYYQLRVECRGKLGRDSRKLSKIMCCEFGWEEIDMYKDKEVYTFSGEGSLYGGHTEEEAHKQIVKRLRKIDKKMKVQTTWTYMEDLPYNTYGSIA